MVRVDDSSTLLAVLLQGDNPKVKVEECLQSVALQSERQQRDFIKRQLRTPVGVVASIDILASAAAGVPATESTLAGGLDFFIFCCYAEMMRNRRTSDAELVRRADACLSSEFARQFIITLHKLDADDEKRCTRLTYLATGTTSYVLRGGEDYVLKLVKHRYFEHPRLTDNTKSYFTDYDGIKRLENVCRIVSSEATYIVMEYADGRTLREYMEAFFDRGVREFSAAHLEFVGSVFDRLTDVLEELARLRTPLNHLDLSPDNIIVKVKDGRPSTTLIDFGYNHLLNEGIGTIDTTLRVSRYIDPWLIKQHDRSLVRHFDLKHDVYSLGVILVDLLLGNMRKERAWDLSVGLDQLWREAPAFATIVEDMVDQSPDNRLLGYSAGADAYVKLRQRLDDEIQLQSTLNEQLATRKEKLKATFGFVWTVVSRDWTSPIFELFITGLNVPADSRLKRLLWFRKLAQALVTFIAAVAVGIWLRDLDTMSWVGWLPSPETVWPGVSGRLTGVSFAIIAGVYYVNIFSALDATRVTGRLALWTERLMRVNAWMFSLPILSAILFIPGWWPFCGAIGIWFVAANNYLCARLADHGHAAMEEHFPNADSPALRQTITEFRNWWKAMFSYGMVLFLIGLLKLAGRIQDEAVFALFVAGILNVLILKKNCTELAPNIRGMLGRLFECLERAQIKKQSAGSASPV